MELKPCPFCGSEALISDVGECYCSKNDCIYFSTFTKDMWNTRPIEDELQRKLDECKESLKDCRLALTTKCASWDELKRKLDIAVERINKAIEISESNYEEVTLPEVVEVLKDTLKKLEA